MNNTFNVFGKLCCQCQRPATQIEHQLCDRCWVIKYSKQNVDGESIPFTEWFKNSRGAKKQDESREEWFERCEWQAKSGIVGTIKKVKGQEVAEGSSAGDTADLPQVEA